MNCLPPGHVYLLEESLLLVLESLARDTCFLGQMFALDTGTGIYGRTVTVCVKIITEHFAGLEQLGSIKG